jgi:hypothetical protein
VESLEGTEGARVKGMVQEGELVLLSLHADPDETCGKRQSTKVSARKAPSPGPSG